MDKMKPREAARLIGGIGLGSLILIGLSGLGGIKYDSWQKNKAFKDRIGADLKSKFKTAMAEALNISALDPAGMKTLDNLEFNVPDFQEGAISSTPLGNRCDVVTVDLCSDGILGQQSVTFEYDAGSLARYGNGGTIDLADYRHENHTMTGKSLFGLETSKGQMQQNIISVLKLMKDKAVENRALRASPPLKPPSHQHRSGHKL